MTFLICCIIFLIINWMTVKIYLFMLDMVLLVAAVKFLKRENTDFWKRLLSISGISAAAYVLVRVVRGNIVSWDFRGRGFVFDVLIGLTLVLYAIFAWKLLRADDAQKEKQKEDEPLLSIRKYDLERIETYLKQVNIVGMNGSWGTGKSFLVEKFCEKNRDVYESVRVDLLTCNQDQADLFLLQEMEAILRKNGIYPRYSRKLSRMMKDTSWFTELMEFLHSDNDVKAVVLDGFKADMKKLHKPVVIIIEDLDRVSDEKFIRKILDLTERLSCDWIKILIEYDVSNLKRLGFDREYLEKYIPYIVNLTEISLRSLLEKFAEKKEWPRFRHLYQDVFVNSILQKRLGLPGTIRWNWKRISIRKVKTFLTECSFEFPNLVGQNPEYQKTAVTFFAMKHFSPEIYEQISLKNDFIEELRFQCPGREESCHLMELFALRRWNEENQEDGLSLEQTRNMFLGDSEAADENRQKLCILCSMGYNFYVMDQEEQELEKIEHSQGGFKGEERLEHRYSMDLLRAEHLEWNEKVSRLIANLYANGRSEWTNKEENARMFIQDVLLAEPDRQEKAWEKFGQTAYQEDYTREDNETIFSLGGNRVIELAQAIYLYMQKNPQGEDRVRIWLRFIEFSYRYFMKEKQITPEYIRWCNMIKADHKEIFLEVIRRFQEMEIVGNLNEDREYLKFLKNYDRYGYALGYFGSYDDWLLDLPEWNEKQAEYVKEVLLRKAEQAEKEAESGIFGDPASGELRIAAAFLRKNVQLIETKEKAKKAQHTFHMESRTRYHYVNEEVYHDLEEQRKSGIPREKYVKQVQEAYRNGTISLAEMRRLLG